MKNLSNIKELVTKIANRRGISREASAAFVCHKYRDLAPKVVCNNILDHSFPKHFKDSILTIAVENSAWAQEIHMCKINLLAALNKELSPHKIKEIRVLISRSENILT